MNENLVFLVAKLSRYQKKYLNLHLKDTDLEDSQAAILIKIKEHINITPKEIFEMRIVEKPSVTKILKKLEELEYIKKVYSENDGRSYSVAVTDKGFEMCCFIEEILVELNSRYKKLISDRFSEDLMKILNEIYGEYV
ncbi:MarR family transcriptional regulator [Cetobacterium sp. 8H]|uniref:MarR family winged helix-turn-helix transcriptional regulator n=1 Tax=Cetobacterium sp. 8H TaxID=2759681 RepID=UPI00163C8017|nr:MarR family transcriptional regulator [Cetobacterium sp. 8H]MBC2852066.1 MarR family transcriptional regulator [Cetobacterium sp. 8H]